MRKVHVRNAFRRQGDGCSPRSLAHWLALALGAGGSIAQATTFVSSCADDNGPGTLRSVLAGAANGDTIDAWSQSACSTITLTQGEIAIPVSVTVQGPPTGTLTINAAHNGRVFRSTSTTAGSNSLTLLGLTLTGGRTSSSGGCVATGQLTLQNSTVTDCIANGSALVIGGAVVVDGDATVQHSRIENSAAQSTDYHAYGGGLHARTVHCFDSTISGNSTQAPSIDGGSGVAVTGYLYASGCTIDSNSGRYGAGIAQFIDATNAVEMKLFNSTISGNRASGDKGGIFAGGGLLTMWNTTVAFNSATLGCGGVYAFYDVDLFSSIVANNEDGNATCVQVISDTGNARFFYSLVSSARDPVPANSLIADPKLTPLADHGGPTRTHGLSASSPAIDHGDNVYRLTTDQRGAGFAREASTTISGVFAADIGAFERQLDDDEIFYGGFR